MKCVHFWDVPSPEKERVPVATCRNCGETREMMNYTEISYWRNSKGVRPKTAGRKKAKT